MSTGPTPSPSEAKAASEVRAFARLKMRVTVQTWIMAALGVVMLVLLPMAHPIELYFARNPDDKVMRMASLTVPNMTNRAVLAWSTTAITEVMTMGFGDIDSKMPGQKWRFTPAGWKAYDKAFVNEEIGKTFRQNQLVLTTVPSDTAVIVSQGVNPDHIYQWQVQMPVIMTYATNGDIARQQRGIVTLILVRVPSEQSESGLAIDSWIM